MAILETRVSAESPSFIANKTAMSELVGVLKQRLESARAGGGPDAARQNAGA
jgi:hypothetical protein